MKHFYCIALILLLLAGCSQTKVPIAELEEHADATPDVSATIPEESVPLNVAEELPAPLRALRLDNTEVDDAELERIIRQNPELVELTLGGTQVTDEGLIHLTQLPRLRVLRLSRTAITDAGMSVLAKCETLESIDVSQTQVGDQGVWELRALPRLRILNLFQTRVTDRGLASFQDAEHRSAARIERLNLDRCLITDDGIAKLASLPNLSWLHLGVTAITDTALAELAKFESLTEVIVTRTETTLEGVEQLRRARPNMNVRDNVSENVSPEAIEEATEFRRQWTLR